MPGLQKQRRGKKEVFGIFKEYIIYYPFFLDYFCYISKYMAVIILKIEEKWKKE